MRVLVGFLTIDVACLALLLHAHLPGWFVLVNVIALLAVAVVAMAITKPDDPPGAPSQPGSGPPLRTRI